MLFTLQLLSPIHPIPFSTPPDILEEHKLMPPCKDHNSVKIYQSTEYLSTWPAYLHNQYIDISYRFIRMPMYDRDVTSQLCIRFSHTYIRNEWKLNCFKFSKPKGHNSAKISFAKLLNLNCLMLRHLIPPFLSPEVRVCPIFFIYF